MNIDEHTNNAIEIVSEGTKLTSQLILFVLKSAVSMLEDDKERNKLVIDNSTKEGKQKINDLIKKHKGGIEALEGNLTKEQLSDYQKELKKLGVDFSIVKNGKDNYSFFFAGEQSSIIEKALKNVLEQKSQVLNNDKVKEAELDLNAEKNNFTEKEIVKVKNIYDDISDKTSLNNIKEQPETKDLSEKEKNLISKMKTLDEIEKEVQSKISAVFQDIKKEYTLDLNSSKNNDSIDNKNNDIDKIEKQNELSPRTKEESKEILREKLSQLDNKQLGLFLKRMEYENLATSPVFDSNKTYKAADELTKMQKDFSKEEIQKINNLDREIRNLNNFEERNDNPKLTANEILKETKEFNKDRQKERESKSNILNIKKYSIENVKKLDQEIKAEEKDKPVIRKKEQSL
ncbi:hypothetical protein SFC57_24075 [Niallia circulans]|uniref:DUF3801 domain-containing protein n=1 Tax=Bacillaceae TaxID=186817 RepID=UPI0039785493